MADNIILNLGSGGDTTRAEDIAGVKIPVVKIHNGADGVDGGSVTAANPLSVSGPLTDAQLRAAAVPVSLTSTTITGSVAVTGPLTDAQLRATAVPISGTVAVSNPGLTDVQLRASAVPVSLASTTITGSVTTTLASTTVTNTVATSSTSLPLPTGASTSALQTTGNISVASIDTKIPALGQALAASSTPVVLTAAQITTLTPLSSVSVSNFPASQAVTGTFFQATQPVSASSLPLPSGASSETTLSALNTKVPSGLTVTANRLQVELPAGGTGLTDTELRASAVPISGTVTANLGTIAGVATETTLATRASETNLTSLKNLLTDQTNGSTGAITTADISTVTSTGANGQPIYTGTATGSSSSTTLLSSLTNQPFSGVYRISGTWVGTLQLEGSFDSGVTYHRIPMVQENGQPMLSTSGNGLYTANISGFDRYRIRATAFTSGTANINLRATHSTNVVSVLNFPATQPVSAAALPLPTGASTETTLAALNTKVPSGLVVTTGRLQVELPAGSSGLTNTELRASAVPVSLTSTTITGSVATTGVNPSGTATASAETGIDAGNTTTANLAGGATFTGAWKDAANYSNLSVMVFTSHVSALDGLNIEYSTDGVTVHDTDVHTIVANNGQQLTFPVLSRFYRIRYVNGATLTTTLQIQTKLHASRPKSSSFRLSNVLDLEADVELVKAVRQQDVNRNARHFMLDAYVAAPVIEAVQSVVQWYGNAAVAGTTQPAVVPAGKTLRLQSWSISTKSLATVGSAVVRIRVNTAGLGVLASPLVFSFEVGSKAGSATTAMTGGLDTLTGVFPEGFEIPAGSGLAFSMAGYGPAGVLGLQGVTRFQVHGYEY